VTAARVRLRGVGPPRARSAHKALNLAADGHVRCYLALWSHLGSAPFADFRSIWGSNGATMRPHPRARIHQERPLQARPTQAGDPGRSAGWSERRAAAEGRPRARSPGKRLAEAGVQWLPAELADGPRGGVTKSTRYSLVACLTEALEWRRTEPGDGRRRRPGFCFRCERRRLPGGSARYCLGRRPAASACSALMDASARKH
jgi:hypothetical protein